MLFIISIMIVAEIMLIWLCIYYKKKSDHDGLSGLFNRNAVEKKINRVIIKQKYTHTMLMIDINNFKRFNDTYGHHVGDSIIKHISYSLLKHFGDKCIIGRVGGDEFIVFTARHGEDFNMERAIDSFLSSLDMNLNDSTVIRIDCSIGIAKSERGDNFYSIYCRSDKLMYDAKALKSLNTNKTADFK